MDSELVNHLASRLRDAVKAVRETAIMLREEAELNDWEHLSTLPPGLPDPHTRGFVAPLGVINAAISELMPKLYAVVPRLDFVKESEAIRRPIQSKADLLSALDAVAGPIADTVARLPVERLKASIRNRYSASRLRGIELLEEGARWFYLHAREFVRGPRLTRGAVPEVPLSWAGPRKPEDIQYPPFGRSLEVVDPRMLDEPPGESATLNPRPQ